MADSTQKVGNVLASVLIGLDENISEYLTSVLSDDPLQNVRKICPSVWCCLMNDGHLSSLHRLLGISLLTTATMINLNPLCMLHDTYIGR